MLQYPDDTLFFFEANTKSVFNIFLSEKQMNK